MTDNSLYPYYVKSYFKVGLTFFIWEYFLHLAKTLKVMERKEDNSGYLLITPFTKQTYAY